VLFRSRQVVHRIQAATYDDARRQARQWIRAQLSGKAHRRKGATERKRHGHPTAENAETAENGGGRVKARAKARH